MHMLVGVHVVEGKTSRAKRLELCSDLLCKLTSNSRQKEKPDSSARHIWIEHAISAYEVRNLCSRQRRNTIDQNEVQPNPESGQLTGARHGVGCRRGRNHQARDRQDTLPMGGFYCFVYSGGEPEIVRADDQASQLAISRLRRNWKNSTPSRNRRRIISGLLIISATREAIFPRRK